MIFHRLIVNSSTWYFTPFLTRLFLFCGLLATSGTSLLAQPVPEELVCGADHWHTAREAYFHPLRQRQDSLERDLYQLRTQKSSPQPKSFPPPYVIPVVFHIIHQNGPENSSDAQILQALEWLNESFANVNYYDRGTGLPTQIQFCLAQRDPNNNPTNGITRQLNSLTDVTFATDLAMKNLARWNPREYLNIYVVREICRSEGSGCNVAGYAYYPAAHGSGVDGIVVEARYTGISAARNTVLTHEAGHYLGLAHTFDRGCSNDDCLLDGDRVCDTPPDQSTAGIPCDQSMNSCDTDANSGFATDQNDMINNYMDYSRLSCYDAFTQGQRDRMHFFLDGIRASLLQSPACLPPCPNPVVATFTPSGPNEVAVGTLLTFTNNSTAATSYRWLINGVEQSNTTNFSYTFLDEGFYTITLVAASTDPLCFPASFSWSLRVFCSLEAAFVRDVAFPIIGDTIRFSAQDATATTYQYTLNGSPVATTAAFDTSILVPGLYEICLEVSRANCRRQVCRFFGVRTPPPPVIDTCGLSGSQFVQRYTTDFGTLVGQRLQAYGAGQIAALAAGEGTLTLVLQDAFGNYQAGHTFYLPGSGLATVDYLLVAGDSLFVLGTIGQFNSSTANRMGFIMQVDLNDPAQFWLLQQPEVSRYATATLQATSAGQELLYVGVRRNTGLNGATQLFIQSLDISTLLVNATSETTFSSGGGLTAIDGLSDGTEIIALGSRSSPINLEAPIYYRWQQSGVFTAAIQLPNIQAASWQPLSIVREANETFILYRDPTSPGSVGGFYLAKFTAAGQRFVQYYQSSDLLQMHPKGLAMRNGQLMLIGEDRSAGSLFLSRLDPLTGIPMWSSRFSSSAGWLQLHGGGNQLMYIHDDESIQWVASLLGGGPDDGVSEMLIARSSHDQVAASACFQTEPIKIIATPWQNQWQGVNLTEVNNGPMLEITEAGQEPFSPLPLGACGLPCEEDPGGNPNNPEICNNGIDDDGNGFTDCEDPALVLTCCCLTGPSIDLGPDTVFCPNQFAGLRLAVSGTYSHYQWQDGSRLDHFLATTAGTYTLLVTDSCGRSDSASIRLIEEPPSPPFSLGPDQTFCDNGVLELNAGSGWASILWSDFTQAPSATFYDEGLHWATVTDACGRSQSDTVRLTIIPTTVLDLPDEILLCPEDSTTISLSGFETYRWAPLALVDCPTCNENTIAAPPLGEERLIQIVASLGNGQCVSVDSVRLRSVAASGNSSQIQICLGESYLWQGTILTQPGVYTAAASCGAVDTLRLMNYPAQPPTNLGQLRICEGDSILVFGTFQSLEGQYTNRLSDRNGCDSLLAIELVVEAAALTIIDSQFVCPGDTAVVFGLAQSAPGWYEQRLQTARGCDSLLRRQLLWWDAPRLRLLTSAEPGDTLVGVSLRIEGGTPAYTIAWSEGSSSDALLLAAGTYQVLVTDANGCSDSLAVELSLPAAPIGLYLPNAFSPNGDGVNDRWWPYASPAVEQIEQLQIYERWGGMVFSATNFPPNEAQFGWDGSFRDRPLTQGVYVYQLTYRLRSGEVVRVAGELSLLR